jgi:RimJ/RimL family protein N-acetyltransferase
VTVDVAATAARESFIQKACRQMNLKCERASKVDLPFIMATERITGYDAFVGRWDEARHLDGMEDDRYAYFLAKVGTTPVGFAIVRDWASPERVTCVKRIAVASPGNGLGRRFLNAVVAAIFANTDAHRIWLGVFPDNERARRAYAAVGFKAEGVARGSAFFDGVHRDELIMAIIRTEWTAAPAMAAADIDRSQ